MSARTWRQGARDRHMAMLRETLRMILSQGLTDDLRQHAEIVLAATTEMERARIGRVIEGEERAAA